MPVTQELVEGKWDCDECETKGVLGRYKRCLSCGNPRSASELQRIYFDDNAPAIGLLSEGDRLLHSIDAAGRDWACSFCEGTNRGDSPHCEGCAAPRFGGNGPPEPSDTRKFSKLEKIVDQTSSVRRDRPVPAYQPS